MRRRRAALAALVAPVLLLAGCTVAPGPVERSAHPSPTASPAPPPSGAHPPRVDRMVALGDSLSRGFDACDHYGDCPSASWSTGTDPRVDSIASRLAAATGTRPWVANDARSGVTSADLGRQVEEAIAARPNLVTVLIGGNDACRADVESMTPVGAFASRVTDALGELAAARPAARILVASVPDVTALLPAAAHDATARFVWAESGVCASALANPLSQAPGALARRAAVRDRIRQYNESLRTACDALPNCTFDGGALGAYRPTHPQLSALDLFHPSITGLRALAALEWAAAVRALQR